MEESDKMSIVPKRIAELFCLSRIPGVQRSDVPFARPKTCGFTLIELLSVIAAISLLLTILIPTGTIVRKSAREAKTKVVFSQWTLALEQFKQEYGYYPYLYLAPTGSPPPAPEIAFEINHPDSVFYELLSGLDKTGVRISDPGTTVAGNEAFAQNARSIRFLSFSSSEVLRDGSGDVSEVVDPFGNTEVWILFDRDGDGRIGRSDFNAISDPISVSAAEIAPEDVFATIAIYSAGAGGNAGDVIRSWE